jgi:hypothetical protein
MKCFSGSDYEHGVIDFLEHLQLSTPLLNIESHSLKIQLCQRYLIGEALMWFTENLTFFGDCFDKFVFSIRQRFPDTRSPLESTKNFLRRRQGPDEWFYSYAREMHLFWRNSTLDFGFGVFYQHLLEGVSDQLLLDYLLRNATANVFNMTTLLEIYNQFEREFGYDKRNMKVTMNRGKPKMMRSKNPKAGAKTGHVRCIEVKDVSLEKRQLLIGEIVDKYPASSVSKIARIISTTHYWPHLKRSVARFLKIKVRVVDDDNFAAWPNCNVANGVPPPLSILKAPYGGHQQPNQSLERQKGQVLTTPTMRTSFSVAWPSCTDADNIDHRYLSKSVIKR